MLQAPGRCQHQVVAPVFFMEELEQRLPGKPLDGLLRPEDRKAQGMTIPEDPFEEIMDVFVRRVLHHVDLLLHDGLFLFDLLRVKERAAEDIRQEFNGKRQVVIGNFHIKGGQLFAGEGIHDSADRIDLRGDIKG